MGAHFPHSSNLLAVSASQSYKALLGPEAAMEDSSANSHHLEGLPEGLTCAAKHG